MKLGKSVTAQCAKIYADVLATRVWPGGAIARTLYPQLKRSQVRVPAVSLSGNNLG